MIFLRRRRTLFSKQCPSPARQKASLPRLRTYFDETSLRLVIHNSGNDNANDGNGPQIREEALRDRIDIDLDKVGRPNILGVCGVAASLDTLSRQECTHNSKRINGSKAANQRSDAATKSKQIHGTAVKRKRSKQREENDEANLAGRNNGFKERIEHRRHHRMANRKEQNADSDHQDNCGAAVGNSIVASLDKQVHRFLESK